MANLFLNSWATTIFGRGVVSVLSLALALNISTASHPTHRYSFDANANDSIGTAHGTVIGNAMITNGNLMLNGTNGGVQLPANLFTNSKSLTLEIWFERQNVANNNLWIFSGTPTIGYLMSINTPLVGEVSRGYYGNNYGTARVDSSRISAGKPYHLVWTQDEPSSTARVFLNGQLVGQNTNFTATPGTTTTASYLGGTPNSAIKGSISEFRIYSNALSLLEVLQSASLGPDALPTDGDAITNLFMRAPSHLALHSITRPPVFADFTHQSAVNLTPLPEIVFTLSDTNVLTLYTNGYLRAVGLGTADIIATYSGHSATSTVTVVAANQFALAHRYNFHGTPGSTNLPDLAGNAPGTVVGGGVFTNGTLLFLDGANDHVDLPDGILSSLSEVTMETWVTGFSLNGKWWPRVFDFGWSGSSASYFFLAPSVQNDNLSTNTHFIRFAVTTNGIVRESPRLTAKPWMADGFETHLVVTYSPARNASKLYVNGVLADSGLAPYPLSLITDTNNWLGRSQFPNDAYFQGVFDEFRIYRTVLEASQVAASFALGPDVIGADYALQGQQIDNQLKLSWGPSASWCVLETSPALATGIIWTNAAVTPVFNNGRMEVTVPLSNTARFFRLSPP
jgi:hypothetical protein